MSDDEQGPIDNVIRLVVTGARDSVAAGGPNPTDRILLILTLVGVAVMISWPKDKPAPEPLVRAGRLAQYVWDRRSWWLDR